MRRVLTGVVLLFLLISCCSGKAVFICDEVYAATVIEPYRVDRILHRAVKKAGYGYGFLEIPVSAVLSEVIPESAAVVILSPFLAKQAEACAAGFPDTVFVVLEQKLQTRLPNLKGLPRSGEKAYGELGTLFGRLSLEAIPDPFTGEDGETEDGTSDPTAIRPPSDSFPEEEIDAVGESDESGEAFPRDWQPVDGGESSPTVILKPAVVFANLSTEKEKNYLSFVNAFAAVNPRVSTDLVSLELPSSRDPSSLNRLSGELTSRRCNLIFLDAASMTPQLIDVLSTEQVLLAVYPAPPTESLLWKNIDMVLEWDYASAFEAFFAATEKEGGKEIFLELKIKKYKKDSILYPYYAEKIIDK